MNGPAVYLALRSYLLPLHRWTGMTVGLVIVLMALTGAVTMFRPQLEPVFDRALLTVPNCAARLPLDDLADAARAVHPGVRLDAVHLMAGADAEPRMPAAELRFADQRYVYVNPCDGAVLGQRARFGGIMGSIEQLHRFRFMRNGSLVTGACALLFAIVMVGGGLCLWLPATLRGIGNALRFNLSFTGQARRLNRHKTIGVYAALVVLSSALTGMPQALPWVESALYALAGSAPAAAPAMAAPPAAARLPIEALWQRAQALVPQPREALMYVGAAPVEAWLIAHDAPHPNARSMLWLDPASGATLAFVPYPRASAGHRLFYWTLSWHTGQIGGWPVQLLLLAGALCIPALAYTGIGSYLRRVRRKRPADRLVLKVARKRAENGEVCSFELVDPDGAALPPFAAGAHIRLHIGGAMLRDYSLCNAPGETHRYEIAVLRERHSRGGSQALHEKIAEGDLIEASLPRNHFPLVPHAGHSLLLAGGIGITPLLAMAEQLARDGSDFTFHYCARSADSTPFIERLRRAPYAACVRTHFSDGAAGQLINLPALLAHRPPGAQLYVCGPVGFITLVLATARELGWPDGDVHKEYFASDVAPSEGDTAFEVTVASSGKVYPIGRDQSVLAALAAAGVAVPSACRQGVCGTCVTRVLAGEPEHRDRYLTVEEHARNDQFAPCCSRARSKSLVLDL